MPEMVNREPMAELRDVRFSYDGGAHWTLDGLNLTIMPGERVCLIGANGSGKSTLARLLAGLTAPDSGDIRLLGQQVFRTGAGPDADAYRMARRGIGAVFQKPEDQIVTTVLEDDVAFGPENLAVEHRSIGERIASALQRVGLDGLRQADPTRMSGGQQQRAAIAGMLAMQPKLLVLDEPTAMLDETARGEVMRVLDDLQRHGTTIVHVTHRPEETAHATRILRLENGTLTQVDGMDAGAEVAGNAEVAGFAENTGNAGNEAAAATETAGIRTTTNAHATAPLVSVEHLSYTYPGALSPAINDLSLTINTGEIVAIMGPNGAGKSTLARILCALAAPNAGTVTISGIPVARPRGRGTRIRYANRKQRARIHATVGYIMQHPERQLFAQTVADDIAYGPRNQGLTEQEITQRVNETMQLLHIEHLASRSPFALSGGQQRLVAIAGVLACQPKLVIMDEPAAGLDAAARHRFHTLIRHLREQGVAVMLITHDGDEARTLADRIIRIPATGASGVTGTGDDSGISEGSADSAGSDNSARSGAQSRTATSFIGRLDPRVKLPAFLLVMMCAFAITNIRQLAVGACAVACVLLASRIGARRLWRSIRVFLVLFALMGLANVFFVRTGTTLATIGPIPITDDGLAISALYICRFTMVIILGSVFLATTTPTAITDAAAALCSPLRRFGVHTQEVALVFSLALRFMPTLATETRAIMDAQSARGGSIETGSPARRLHAMAAIIVPVFAGALRHADDLGLALDARCYEEGIHRTHWRVLRIETRDIIFMAATALTIIGIIAFAFLP
ncbi:ATP-binding cassette domain-containing protein [Bifidobacterium sp. 64T4]|uniref:energy-coupling factor transporter ATPase n=1 Tax=Bifidobacterium pongonis TaxID=2834432 RepID=UPI001C59EF1B|nr:energy-coupling factor transporter ATPase [Bifidobacterium pongonis]MBW3094585.1 ATP-binding cassette domain-containing protein [Bifidobacterium pongonis]